MFVSTVAFIWDFQRKKLWGGIYLSGGVYSRYTVCYIKQVMNVSNVCDR